MHDVDFVLHQFRTLLPSTRKNQDEALNWLSMAHSQAESVAKIDQREIIAPERMKKLFTRFGCKPTQISQRYSVHDDFTHLNFDRMEIFNLRRDPKGATTAIRNRVFARVVNGVFERFYMEDSIPPGVLLHVTCTGYDSPSGAERVVASKRWGDKTEVYHLYHMGCYAAVPAIRIAQGLAQSRVDIVHTELCSLHLDLSQHSPEQMVIQSLFADGMIRYSLQKRSDLSGTDRGPMLQIVTSRKEIVDGSETAMTWSVGDRGMEMTLSREVPDLIAINLKSFINRLYRFQEDALFAIHPGGPRIVDQIQDMLDLKDDQVKASRKVLLERGNMSSATLPHIWKEILDDVSVPENTPIVSLAFGPGLTICGNVLRKTCV
jgi:predicted naringenin-chalcone synthase